MLPAAIFLPLWQSLAFLTASAAVILYRYGPFAVWIMEHPKMAPGAEKLRSSICHSVLLACGMPASSVPHSGLCRLMTPRWLVLLSVTFVGVAVPLYLIHYLFEGHVVATAREVQRGRQPPRLRLLDVAASALLVHLPILLLIGLVLAVALTLVA